MSDLGDNTVLEHLRHIRTAVEESRHDVRELRTQVGYLEKGGRSARDALRAHIHPNGMERLERRVGLADA